MFKVDKDDYHLDRLLAEKCNSDDNERVATFPAKRVVSSLPAVEKLHVQYVFHVISTGSAMSVVLRNKIRRNPVLNR